MMNSFKNKRIWLRLVRKRYNRRIRCELGKKIRRKKFLNLVLEEKRLKKHGIESVHAPAILALAPHKLDGDNSYESEHAQFVEFKDKLELAAQNAYQNSDKRLMISFTKTYALYADACILLMATLDSIKHRYPDLRFIVKRPDKNLHKKPNKDKHQQFFVDAVFCHIGLYKLLGLNYCNNTVHRNVQSWHYVYSDQADGDVTNPIFDKLEAMGMANLSELYGSVIESIANAMEHAYNPNIVTERQFPVHRWWMLMAKMDDKLRLLICDLGHGIPNTLRENKEEGVLQEVFKLVFSLLKRKMSSDSADILASTLIKETRTKLAYRGKGGKDLKYFIEKMPESNMMIHSNRGSYRYSNGKLNAIVYDNQKSINGTLITWSMPIAEDHKEE